MEFNNNQLKAINVINGNAVINATAGSGKTSTLVERIDNMISNGVNPENILCVTFSKKAKENMIEKIAKRTHRYANRVNVETFHSLALKIIKAHYGDLYTVWTKQWEKEKQLFEICKSMRLCSVQDDMKYGDIFTFIGIQKRNRLNSSVDVESVIHINNLFYKDEDLLNIWQEYEEFKDYNKFIEFDDFMNIVIDIFDKNIDVLEYYQDKFKYILMDEAQDINESQYMFISSIAKGNNNFFIVGDMLQSIYTFMGGSSKYMLDFDINWNATPINFDINYRCSKDIVELSNLFVTNLNESNHRNYKQAKSFNGKNKLATYCRLSNDTMEIQYIIDKIKSMVDSKQYTYDDFAVLSRTNAQLQKFQFHLYNNDIPFDIQDGTVFTEQYEIKLLLSYLKLADNVFDNDAFRFCFNKPNRWLNKKFLEEVEGKTTKMNNSLFNAMFLIDRRNWRFKNGIDELAEVVNIIQNKKFKNVGDIVKYLRDRLDIDDFVTKSDESTDVVSEKIENIITFQNMCNEFSSIKELIYNVDNLNDSMAKDLPIDKIKLMTIHKSKGLEFKVVFIIGLNDGLLPHVKAISEVESDSEKRLMYVAITRAEKELFITSCKEFNSIPMEESPFMKFIKDNTIIEKYKPNNQL